MKEEITRVTVTSVNNKIKIPDEIEKIFLFETGTSKNEFLYKFK
jgi:hypothetical protein